MKPSINRSITSFFTLLSILFIIGFPQEIYLQNRALGTLPIINNGEVIVNQEGDLNDTEDGIHIRKIYDDLVAARGDYRYKVPELFLKDVEGRVASINYNTNQITIEKKAYDVCKKHGDAAVAFLIGHELTHYYEKHAWQNGFVASKSAQSKYQDIKRYQDIAHETEADYLGGFLAYTAGYGMYDQGDSIISDLYAAYGLGETMDGYPTKTERIDLSKESAKKLQLMVDAFDMANLLYSIGRMDQAMAYYEYILKEYQSREIYNNIGTAAVLAAMEFFHPDDLKFRYVSELDVDFGRSRDVSISPQDMIDSLISQAIIHFNSATILDPDYAPAYLNKANAYSLLRDYKKSKFYLLEEALPVAMKDSIKWSKTIEDIRILEGIIEAKTGDTINAKMIFETVAAQGNVLAQTNLSILNNEELPIINKTPIDFSKDMIGDTSLHKFIRRAPPFNLDLVGDISKDYTFFQYEPIDKAYKALYTEEQLKNGKYRRIAFLKPSTTFEGVNSAGVKIGDDVIRVDSLNGTPTKTIQTVRGQYMIYDGTTDQDKRDRGIIYVIEDEKVKSWIIYKAKDSFF